MSSSRPTRQASLRRSTRTVRPTSRLTTLGTSRGQRFSASGALVVSTQRFRVHKWTEEWVTEGHVDVRKFVRSTAVAEPAMRPPGFVPAKRKRHKTVRDLGGSSGISHRVTALTPALLAFIGRQESESGGVASAAAAGAADGLANSPAAPSSARGVSPVPARPQDTPGPSAKMARRSPSPAVAAASSSSASEAATTPSAIVTSEGTAEGTNPPSASVGAAAADAAVTPAGDDARGEGAAGGGTDGARGLGP
jgi:hypothetical protein